MGLFDIWIFNISRGSKTIIVVTLSPTLLGVDAWEGKHSWLVSVQWLKQLKVWIVKQELSFTLSKSVLRRSWWKLFQMRKIFGALSDSVKSNECLNSFVHDAGNSIIHSKIQNRKWTKKLERKLTEMHCAKFEFVCSYLSLASLLSLSGELKFPHLVWEQQGGSGAFIAVVPKIICLHFGLKHPLPHPPHVECFKWRNESLAKPQSHYPSIHLAKL